MSKREGDKMVVDADAAPTTGAYQTEYHQMPEVGRTQELAHSNSCKYAAGGAHELKADTRPGELPHDTTDDISHASHYNHEPLPAATETMSSVVSLHVEAQMKREVEWLGMEETRIRQRREQLLQQGGAKTQ
jgi:hypothetical protein